jgi:branched-chain amino acid transport system substrate-binding protein
VSLNYDIAQSMANPNKLAPLGLDEGYFQRETCGIKRHTSLNLFAEPMNKITSKIVLLLFLISTSSVANAENLKIKIGASLPLTGRVAIAGNDTRAGIELAVEEFSSPGVSFEALFEDNQHDAKQAVSSAHKLLDIDGADILISMWDMADVVAPLAEGKKVPHLAIRWNPDITERYKYTFTVESTYQSYINSLLELLKKQSVHSVALLTENAQGWILADDYFKKQSALAGIAVLADERYLADDSDYKTIILRTVKKSPDMLILLSNPPHTEALIKQIKEVAPKQQFTGYFEIIDPSLINGIPFVAQFEVADWFAKKFKERFGELPKSRAAQGYDIVHLLAIAAKESGQKPTLESLVAAARKNDFSEGAAGPLIIKNPKVIESQCVWKIARNNSFQLYR